MSTSPQPPFPPPVPPPLPLNYGRIVCPRCGCPETSPVSFTWWGGVLGPKLLHVVKCHNCGQQFNGKTGRSNAAGIAIYTIVALILCIIVFGFLFSMWP